MLLVKKVSDDQELVTFIIIVELKLTVALYLSPGKEKNYLSEN